MATNVVSRPLTNQAYGFPSRGDRRRFPPKVLVVIHITGNPSNQGPTAATNERNYANRAGSNGPSAHYYINRDGSGVAAINPGTYAAWSNGDLKSPNMANAGVQYLVQLRGRGFNPNEGCAVEIEFVGVANTAGQLTTAQMEQAAKMVAYHARRTGLAINRNTVLTHADINSVDRARCAFLPAIRETRLAWIIARAKQINAPTLPKVHTVRWTATAPAKPRTIVDWTPEGLKVTER